MRNGPAKLYGFGLTLTFSITPTGMSTRSQPAGRRVPVPGMTSAELLNTVYMSFPA